ncbi:MAG: GMP/IMP nucleotidase [Desulfobulbaceae bacterium]|nr:GMP/IMP nucleotidase [Desulfobulbaceae bacterium]HIJ79764.1 GMP/IMP nucleotidase [Deltaproteobacteria bacterium]
MTREKTAIIDWNLIDTVLLDMDGTLLDKHFDDYFWEHYVPEVYAGQNNLSIAAAKKKLLDRYQSLEGTLAWTDLDYWSDNLGLDIPALKIKVNHLIAIHPYVPEFLKFCRTNGKKIYLVTNAHSKTLAIKMEKTALAGYFDRIICSEEIGVAKEDRGFWQILEDLLRFDRRRTMFADDTERVLDSAATFGFGKLIFVAKPSSKVAVQHSDRYDSIEYFKELLT